jgi:uncharacterized protein (TIGR02246 family)
MPKGFEFKNDGTNGQPARCRRNGSIGRLMSRRALAIVAVAATLCGPGFAFGQNQKQKSKNKQKDEATASSLLPDNTAIDLLVSQMLGAWQAGDTEGMRKFYADDIVVISGAWELPIIGWADYARAYQAQLARTSGSRLERMNSYMKVSGDSAWVTYQWQFVGDVDGKRTQAFGHTTLVLQKRTGSWLIVLNHTSAVPTDEPSSNAAPAPASAPPASALSTSPK